MSIRVRINSAGAREILSSEAVGLRLGEMASSICKSANSKASEDDMFNQPYEYDVKTGGLRARASVVTATPHGIRNNNKYNTLLNSLDAGR